MSIDIAPGQHAEQLASIGCVLALFLDERGSKMGFLRGFFHNLSVIAGDAQLLRQLFAHGSAAAAKLPADGNNLIAHDRILLYCGLEPAAHMRCSRRFSGHSIARFLEKNNCFLRRSKPGYST